MARPGALTCLCSTPAWGSIRKVALPSEKTPLQRALGVRGCSTPCPAHQGLRGEHSPQALAAGEGCKGVGLPPEPALVVAVLPCALPEQRGGG